MSEENKTETRVLTDSVPVTKCSQCGCEIDVAGLEPFLEIECPDCGAHEKVPARLGQFLLLDMIGAGGMGGVYIGRDESLGRNVAIKVMLKSLGENQEFVNFFRREAQAAARLNHVNIVQVYSFGQEKGQPYIVMELVLGPRFDKLLEENKGGMDQALVMQVGADVAEGLNAASDAGLLHGDVKPENILLDEKLQAKLVDFGIASFANQSSPEGIWGTPYYIAPEKLKRQKPDERSDIYSLGATLYHAIAGRPPFEGSTPIQVVKARLDKDPLPLSRYRHNVNKTVEAVIMRMLHANPVMRYPTYPSLISDLKRVLTELGGRKKSISTIRKTGKIAITKKVHIPAAAHTQPQPEPAEIQISAPKTGKIIFHKRTDSAPKKPVLTVSSGKKGAQASSSARRPGGRKQGVKSSVIVFMLLILLGVIGLTVYYFMDKQNKVRSQKRELYALDKAKRDVDREYGDICLLTSNIVKAARPAQQAMRTITNAAFVVLGELLELPAPPVPTNVMAATDVLSAALAGLSNAPSTTPLTGPAPAREPPAVRVQTSAPPTKATAPMKTRFFGKKKEPPPATAAPAPAEAPKEEEEQLGVSKPVVDSEGRESPMGEAIPRHLLKSMLGDKAPPEKSVPTAEELQKQGKLSDDRPDGEPAKPAAEPVKPAVEPAKTVEPEKPPPPPTPVKQEDPEIKKLAKKLLADIRAIEDKVASAKDVQTEAGNKREAAYKQGLDSTSAQSIATAIHGMQETLKPIEKAVVDAVKAVKDGAKKVDDMRIAFEKDLAERKRIEAAAEKQKQEEEARRKREEELKALGQNELTLVKNARDGVVAMIKANKYADAEKTLKEQLATLQTDEAKSKLQVYIDRCVHLRELIKFLAAQMNEKPYAWGWIQDGSALDITGATDKEVKVKGKNVPWTDVSIRQMMAIIDHYLNPRSKLHFKIMAEQYLNAAIYCTENGGKQRAEAFAQTAVEQWPEISKEVQRLLPKEE